MRIDRNKKFLENRTICYERGQVLLVVVLVMVIALTVGLSVAVRSMTSIRIASEDDNSQRAFSAAEAGIERALVNSSDIPLTDFSNNTSYSTTVNPLSGSRFALHNGTSVLKDEPIDIWLSDYSTDTSLIYQNQWSGNLTLYWGKTNDVCSTVESTNTQAALEIILLTGSKASPKITEFLLDPCAPRRINNNFQAPVVSSAIIDGKTFEYQFTIPVASGLIARVIPLYAPTGVGVEGSVGLPSQGTVVTSTGKSDTAQRKIISFREHPKLPLELFPFIYFSPN